MYKMAYLWIIWAWPVQQNLRDTFAFCTYFDEAEARNPISRFQIASIHAPPSAGLTRRQLMFFQGVVILIDGDNLLAIFPLRIARTFGGLMLDSENATKEMALSECDDC